jgi:hypothetical protein
MNLKFISQFLFPKNIHPSTPPISNEIHPKGPSPGSIPNANLDIGKEYKKKLAAPINAPSELRLMDLALVVIDFNFL